MWCDTVFFIPSPCAFQKKNYYHYPSERCLMNSNDLFLSFCVLYTVHMAVMYKMSCIFNVFFFLNKMIHAYVRLREPVFDHLSFLKEDILSAWAVEATFSRFFHVSLLTHSTMFNNIVCKLHYEFSLELFH